RATPARPATAVPSSCPPTTTTRGCSTPGRRSSTGSSWRPVGASSGPWHVDATSTRPGPGPTPRSRRSTSPTASAARTSASRTDDRGTGSVLVAVPFPDLGGECRGEARPRGVGAEGLAQPGVVLARLLRQARRARREQAGDEGGRAELLRL